LARKLGLDPRSLLDEGQPRFVWRDAKFKRLTTESDFEQSALASFGASLAGALTTASTPGPLIEGISAASLRKTLLERQHFVRLLDLLSLCWATGIPVIHLRIFPLSAKRMCAMAVRAEERHAILLGKDATYPAPVAYYLAHEIGHIALGHLRGALAVVDLQDPLEEAEARTDDEERAADQFALELLTGNPEPSVTTETKRFTARQLAENLLSTAASVNVEPGTLALCYGHSTGDWAKSYAAMKFIYSAPHPVWVEVNQIATQEIDWTKISDDFGLFMRAVMGAVRDDGRRLR
jgi:Zn-dependent peptidase ImmA (M78 family)